MCWSLEVSAAASLFELVTFVFLFWRCRKHAASDTPFAVIVRAQLYVLPLVFSVLVVEVCEIIMWSDEHLRPIAEADEAPTCSLRNRWATRLVAFSVSSQPFLSVLACRFTGDPQNDTLLRAPYCGGALYWAANVASLIVGETVELHLQMASAQDFLSYFGIQSCAWLGARGHLHWTLKFSASYLAPNAFTYLVITSSVILARPLRLMSGLLSLYILVLGFLFLAFGFSFEAGSVWCWSAFAGDIFLIAQPHILNTLLQPQPDTKKVWAGEYHN